MVRILKVGTRSSRLALRQVEEIECLVPFVRFEIILIDTIGDRDKITPLSKIKGKDFFTRDIEEALLTGRIDVAIHSAKDLEEIMPEGLTIACMTVSISSHECLVSRNGKSLRDLPPLSRIGTSSQKRKEAILKYRNDLVVKDIRGNIDERLAQLDRGDFDAIIVAHAALVRLGLEDRISQVIPETIIEPHPLQGALAVQVREDRQDLIDAFRRINGK